MKRFGAIGGYALYEVDIVGPDGEPSWGLFYPNGTSPLEILAHSKIIKSLEADKSGELARSIVGVICNGPHMDWSRYRGPHYVEKEDL